MLHRAAPTVRRALSVALTAALGVLGLGAAAVPAQAAGAEQATFTGRGYGHGRGMGQYGALGYAVDAGWTHDRILAHYYGGTTLRADAGNPGIDVELTRLTGAHTYLSGAGLAVNGQPVGSGALSVRFLGDGRYQLWVAPDCGGGPARTWTPWGGPVGSGLTVTSSANQVTVCESAYARGYRGSVVVSWVSGTTYTFNRLAVEDYLRGVVPRESPATWGSLGGGRGLEALKAQAVAARSYALASRRPSGATTCDTTACQVYLGATEQANGSTTVKSLEHPLTDAAVSQTAGRVMRTSAGAIARTEFSSSTGGWTLGGSFPAVEDAGDATALNPHRSWTVQVGLAQVASALGTGAIASMRVSARTGLGPDGGRATSVQVTQTDGTTRTFTANAVRTALGLKSDWFSVSALSTAEVQKVVTALYVDILGRGPDPEGLATWTAIVLRDGDAGQVARGIVMSTERLHTFVAAEYRAALGREPEPGGLQFWTEYLQRGTTVPELQAFIYSSEEGFARHGRDLEAWAGAVYTGVLGREAGPAERAFWAAQAQARGRAEVVRAIAMSDEAGLRRLDRYYRQMLGRGPDPSGIGTFLPLMSGNGDIVLPVHLGSSGEYWARAQTR
ncbi:SpoIID/LytB domain-containing protein [Cellulomonas cellasea]|uniref:SpoIID/LytB domain protein n=1 Tax=Cellulomonas cellasea TaxID=43670 RepID=A0A7W4YAL5_9CELL|nr:SpoIID/LytB domain-containing protein [Cellulomonas cellasea]MBB2922885.1 SpoIID/LytB domain protein [Cellulomonas cellasea]